MKRVLLGLVYFLFMGTVFAGEVSRDGYRDFSSTDGRNIRGRIIKYDAQRKKLFFERDNKKQMWIAPSAFCQEDWDYIKEWIAADQFLSGGLLSITIQKNAGSSKDKETKPDYGTIKKLKPIYYELNLRNRTGATIEDVRIDYRCYVARKGSNEHPDSDYWVSGQIKVAGIKSGNISCCTKAIVMETAHKKTQERVTSTSYDSSTGYYDSSSGWVTVVTKMWEDKVKGIWFKVSGPKLDGEQVVRDVCFPRDFAQKHSWSDADNNAPVPSLNSKEARKKRSEYDRTFIGKLREIEKANAEDKAKMIKELSLLYDAQHDKQGYYALRIGGLYKKSRDFESALSWYEKSLQAGNPGVHRSLAELYSSGCPETFDGAKAVKHALIALEGHEKDYSLVEILARAYARDGQFKMAIRIQRQAIERWQKLTGYKGDYKTYKERLELYKNGKPYTM